MQRVLPYQHSASAIEALDNGGRFYNIFTTAQDNQITAAELATVAGVFGDVPNMMLFLEMSIQDLAGEEQEAVKRCLSPELAAKYLENKPVHLTPSQAVIHAKVAKTAILTGYPRFVEDKTVMKGMILVPIMAGKVMTVIPIPIMDQYDVYELRDESTSTTVFITNVRGADRLPEELARFGGVIKQSSPERAGEGESYKFLESVYYTPLG